MGAFWILLEVFAGVLAQRFCPELDMVLVDGAVTDATVRFAEDSIVACILATVLSIKLSASTSA